MSIKVGDSVISNRNSVNYPGYENFRLMLEQNFLLDLLVLWINKILNYTCILSMDAFPGCLICLRYGWISYRNR